MNHGYVQIVVKIFVQKIKLSDVMGKAAIGGFILPA
jgi:hypothetical protein